MAEMLGERLDRFERFAAPGPFPVVEQLVAMGGCPLTDEAEWAGRRGAAENLAVQ